MQGFGILMIVLGGFTILCGIYFVTGHYSEVLLWRTHKRLNKDELRYLGKVTMFTGLGIVLTGLSGMFLEEDSFVPIIFMFVAILGFPFLGAFLFRDKGDK